MCMYVRRAGFRKKSKLNNDLMLLLMCTPWGCWTRPTKPKI